MKKIYPLSAFAIFILIFQSCHPRMYRTTPVNAPLFANKGEVQVNASMGSSGGTFFGGASITDHIALAGMYNGGIKGYAYQAHEEEGSIGFFSSAKGGTGFCSAIYLGGGGGNNYYQDSGAVVPSYTGQFSKFFVALSGGTTTGGGTTRIKGGAMYALKFTYMTYAGQKSSDQFWGSNFMVEPYFGGSIGGKYFRFEMGMGSLLKLDFKWANQPGSNITMLPLSMNFGFQFILGRHYDSSGSK